MGSLWIISWKATSGVSDEFVSRHSFFLSTPCALEDKWILLRLRGGFMTTTSILWVKESGCDDHILLLGEKTEIHPDLLCLLEEEGGDEISRQRVTTCDSASDSAWIPSFLFFLLVTSFLRTSLIKSLDSTGYLLLNVVLFLSSCIFVPEKQHFFYYTRLVVEREEQRLQTRSILSSSRQDMKKEREREIKSFLRSKQNRWDQCLITIYSLNDSFFLWWQTTWESNEEELLRLNRD